MALPKIDSPIYEIELPLSKKKIKFRPFNVKEQRNLLMAMDSNDPSTMEQNIVQVLNNCTISEELDIESLPLLDVEFYFLQLRARSVGEISENSYECNNTIQAGPEELATCHNIIDVSINILDIQIEYPTNVEDVIKLTPKMSVKLNYPKFSLMKRIKDTTNIADFAFNMIAESIEYIHDGEQFYYAKESSPSELVDFIESLNQEQFSKLETFFNELPRMIKHIEFKCNKCGFEHSMDIEGLESFFV